MNYKALDFLQSAGSLQKTAMKAIDLLLQKKNKITSIIKADLAMSYII